jgi:hypothetical protein
MEPIVSHGIPVQVDVDHCRCIVGGEPMIVHCHHYNTFLQRTVQDAPYIDPDPILVGAAAEVAHAQLTRLFTSLGLSDVGARAALAERVYRWAGFGTLAVGSLSSRGGVVSTPSSHYAMGWSARFGQATSPVCHFASGWAAGALAAVYGRPNGHYATRELACAATGQSKTCSFELREDAPGYPVYQGCGLGTLSEHRIRPALPTRVDAEAIRRALSELDLQGDEDGVISVFGVYATHHYASYLNRISFELVRELSARFGEEGRLLAEPLLLEAGRVCAFHTLGGIMVSTEWDALVAPSIQTLEDWVHGILAILNTFGWGRWQVTRLSAAEAELVLHDDYESTGYLAMYGPSDHPVSYLAHGGIEGLMNLVYLGGIASKPGLTTDHYDALFRRPDVYKAEVLSSRAMGDEVTAFRVYQPG